MSRTTKPQCDKIQYFNETCNKHGHLYELIMNDKKIKGYIMGWQNRLLQVEEIYYENKIFDLHFIPEKHCENYCKEQNELQHFPKISEIGKLNPIPFEIIDCNKIVDIKDLGYNNGHRRIYPWDCC
jgi:hypothetical protein